MTDVKDPKHIFELPDIKRTPPNLENATPNSLVDDLSRVRRMMSRLKKLEGFYKEALKARWPQEETDEIDIDPVTFEERHVKRPAPQVQGEIYTVTWDEVTQNRVDTDAVKELLGDKVPMKETTFVTLRSGGAEDLDEFVIDAGWD